LFQFQGFHVRISPDYKKSSHSFHGFLEVHIDGIWGSVCSKNWDDKAASVACKQMGYTGKLVFHSYTVIVIIAFLVLTV